MDVIGIPIERGSSMYAFILLHSLSYQYVTQNLDKSDEVEVQGLYGTGSS